MMMMVMMPTSMMRLATVTILALASVPSAFAITPSIAGGHWVDTWTAMPQLTEFANLPPPPFNQTNLVFPNSTIRQSIHTSIGASQIRLRISNAFGLNALPITSVTVALPLNGAAGISEIDPKTVQKVTFSGSESIVIPNAALAVSDPLNFPVKPQSMLAITMFLQEGQPSNFITSHPGSRTNTFFAFGNQVSAPNITGAEAQVQAHWFFISALEVWVPQSTRSFAIIGDSITDGRGSDTNANNRWPDLVLARMQNKSSTKDIAVLNQAAGGNRILLDGLGPNALGRVDRDVLAQSGVKYAMIFEGVNDIGTGDPTVANQTAVGDQLEFAFKQMRTRLRAAGIPFFGATITPFGGEGQAYSNPLREQTRQRINSFIRNSGTFDAVIDFDSVVRDSKNASILNPNFDSGDHLHPNDAGYSAMANFFDLTIFDKFANGVSGFQ